MARATHEYDSLPLIIRLIIQLAFGVVVGGIYRLVKYFETKNLSTLIVGILVTFTLVGNVFSWIIDFVSLLLFWLVYLGHTNAIQLLVHQVNKEFFL